MRQNRMLAILLGVLATLVLVVGGLSAALLFSGRGGEGDESADSGGDSPAATSGVLRLSGGDPVTLDPHIAGDGGSAEYIVEIFSGLVTLTPKLELELDLAKSLEVTDGGKTYTFVLRDNATFHNTRRKVTAEDVKWSIERASSRALNSPTAMAYLGDIIGVAEHFSGQSPNVSGVEVVNPSTVRIRIDAPKPYFLAKLTYPTAFVVDRQQVESNPRNWTRKPNGTGPFVLGEWRLGERITLDANQQFYLGAPKLRSAAYLLSGGSALTRFENNEIDIAGISINDIDRARDPSSALGKVYKVFPQFAVFYLAFNTRVPPFDDIHVRRAMSMAVDRGKVVKQIYNDMFSVAGGLIMPGVPGYTEGDKSLPFDPNRAKAELAQSKYANNMPPIVITEVGGGAAAAIDTQAFLEQWKSVLGLNVEIRQTDFATLLADQDAGRLQASNAGWIMDYPDPESIVDLKFHSKSRLNDIGYSNPAVDRLVDAARTEQDTEKRLDLYRQAERLIIEDAPWLLMYVAQSHQVVNPAVKGWFDPPMVLPRLRFIEVTR